MGSSLLSLLLLVVLCAPAVALAQDEPASNTEWWYVLRGRANMQLGNYRAAIEAWQKAVELNSGNREAMKQLGFAYEKQGLTAKAIEQFDRYLERFSDDPDIAFKQAEYLGWERYAYRRADAIRYYRMGLAQREDLARRYALARLLAQERSQLGPALEQYELLLAARPDSDEWRSEYRELLLWDEDRLDDAIREYRRLERERPGNFDVERTLAGLIARKSPRSDEAVARRAALVEKRPRDASLRLAYAELLSADPDRRGLAIEEYRTLLTQEASASHREALADLLSGRADGRDEALSQYRSLLRDQPGLVRVRLKRARLLAAERRDVDAAIREYEIVVEQDPRNAEAHAGLSECYAWTGDLDAALHHSNLAVRHGGSGRDLAELRRALLRGREPRLAPFLDVLVQEGRSKAKLRSVGFGLSGSADVSPFLSLRGRTGFAEYWRSGDDEPTGFLEVDAEYRFDPANELDFGLGYHSLPHSGRNVLARVSYARSGETWTLRGGFERVLRFDSYVALVGEDDGGDEIGSARENRFYGVASAEQGRFEAEIEPYAGFVDAKSTSDNAFVGLRGRLAWRVLETRHFDLTPFYESDLYHYQDDAFGVSADADAEPGGYFSPPLFFEQVPGLALAFRLGEETFLDLEGGPALQVVDESGSKARFEVGARAGLSFVTFLRESLYWTLESDFIRIGEAYTRVAVTTSLTFKF
jgi:tetratricopeptide (TPR) repeat protein